jgi:hypothetical protein
MHLVHSKLPKIISCFILIISVYFPSYHSLFLYYIKLILQIKNLISEFQNKYGRGPTIRHSGVN